MVELDLNKIIKDLNKQYGGAEVVTMGVHRENRAKFSFGTPAMDFTTYNSVPEGAWIELSGAEGSGKTLLSFLIAADFIRKEKLKTEDARRHILFVDAEGTLDPEWAMTAAHYDVQDPDVITYYVQSIGQTAEQLFDIVRDFVATGKIGLVIFDSLTAIAPQQVADESFEKKEMGGIAKPLGDFVKRCTGLFNKYRTTFVGLMGLITNISGYGLAETTPGGLYFRRACSLRIRIKKGAYCDEDWNELKSTAENPAGYLLETCVMKSKFCRIDRRLGQCHVSYTNGIDILADTIDVAINLGLIDNSVQGTYRLIDLDTGEIMRDSNGEDIKIRGKKNLRPYFESHHEEWEKLYNEVYRRISIKNDRNIKSLEELLNIDVIEQFGQDINEE